jgi:ribosomal protein L37E
MRLSQTAVTCIILLVIVAALGSLAYPVVPVSIVSTETIPYSATYIESSSITLLGTSAETIQAPYSTFTAWVYTAYPLCDPASMACPGPPVPVVTTYSHNSIWFYKVASSSLSLGTYATEYYTLTSHTTFENVAIYSAQGLTGAQFAQLAVIAVITAGLLLLFLIRRTTRPLGKDRSVKSRCKKCGAEYLSPTSAYCYKCGAPRSSLRPTNNPH